jgi:hypothetical protein
MSGMMDPKAMPFDGKRMLLAFKVPVDAQSR